MHEKSSKNIYSLIKSEKGEGLKTEVCSHWSIFKWYKKILLETVETMVFKSIKSEFECMRNLSVKIGCIKNHPFSYHCLNGMILSPL